MELHNWRTDPMARAPWTLTKSRKAMKTLDSALPDWRTEDIGLIAAFFFSSDEARVSPRDHGAAVVSAKLETKVHDADYRGRLHTDNGWIGRKASCVGCLEHGTETRVRPIERRLNIASE